MSPRVINFQWESLSQSVCPRATQDSRQDSGAGEENPDYGVIVWAEFQLLLLGVTLVWASVSTSVKWRQYYLHYRLLERWEINGQCPALYMADSKWC